MTDVHHGVGGRRPALADMSDAWLIGRARELRAVVQTSEGDRQRAATADIDDLLAEARRRGEPQLVVELLRSAAMARLSTEGRADEAKALIDEMVTLSHSVGLPIQLASGHALRGQVLILSGNEDAALGEVARSLAILDDPTTDDVISGKRLMHRWLMHALIDVWQRLVELGLFETAEEVVARTMRSDGMTPHDVTLQMINLLELQLSWALWLERIDRIEQARDKFATAAALAAELETPFAESLFRDGTSKAIDQIGIVAAAAAMAVPESTHIERLRRLFAKRFGGQEKSYIGIALARCLEEEGKLDDARDVLVTTQETAKRLRVPSSVTVTLAWELARFEWAHHSQAPSATRMYAKTLENEFWQMREARRAALHTRRQHERLTAEHGAVAKQAEQALKDPLTGLANRRALDDRLRQIAAASPSGPLSVALIDLDGFKRVNDNKSHAEGDDVLRVIASTLRDALRGDDFVARYGGDEFVVLLPGASPTDATLAMRRTASAVADLPRHLSHGVTLSIGLVSMAPGEHPESVLTRADRAMYRAKRGGGNRVTAATDALGNQT